MWASTNVAPVLREPMVRDLPCTWYDPIPVDRELALGASFSWHEYEITVHELTGHTLYAAGFEFVVDGVRVLVTGDQQDGLGVPGERRNVLNYQYRNRFRIEDFRDSAALYRTVAPDLMISGHWLPRWVDRPFLEQLAEEGEQVVHLHHDLLPLDELDVGADGVFARIEPYFSEVAAGATVRFTVRVRNPHPDAQDAIIRLVTPVGWSGRRGRREVHHARVRSAGHRNGGRRADRHAAPSPGGRRRHHR